MIKYNFNLVILNSLIISLLLSGYSLAQGLAYFGQEPPGMVPVRFPPASLLANHDWFWHGSPNLSPDLMEMYWVKYTIYPTYERMELAFVEVEDTQWTQMQVPTFADLNYDENNPFFSNNGDTLYFISERSGRTIFYVSRTSTGWSQPTPLNIPLPPNTRVGWGFSVAKNKSIYLELWTINGASPPDIYKSSYINGQYTMPENIGMPVNTSGDEFNPFIDPDEQFLIFVANRPGGYGFHDLYLSSKNQDGTWNDPINLGPGINSGFEDVAPYISPDGLYFFFNTEKTGDLGYNPYWVDAQVVYNLITDVDDGTNAESPVTFQLYQNYPNPFNAETTIFFELKRSAPIALKIYDLLGNEVQTVFQDIRFQAGIHSVCVNAGRLASGVYFYRLELDDSYIQTKKMCILK